MGREGRARKGHGEGFGQAWKGRGVEGRKEGRERRKVRESAFDR